MELGAESVDSCSLHLALLVNLVESHLKKRVAVVKCPPVHPQVTIRHTSNIKNGNIVSQPSNGASFFLDGRTGSYAHGDLNRLRLCRHKNNRYSSLAHPVVAHPMFARVETQKNRSKLSLSVYTCINHERTEQSIYVQLSPDICQKRRHCRHVVSHELPTAV